MRINPTVRTFTPELWKEIDIFRHFHKDTHTLSHDAEKALSGISNHFRKGIILRDLAHKLQANFELDNQELLTQGFTSAINSDEFSAVIEEVFTELYSSIDCTKKVIVFIYKKTRSLPDSTRKLFQRVKDNQLGNDFPTELQAAIKSAEWYEELRTIRDELTHSDIGVCRQDEETKIISYTHFGIRKNNSPLTIHNVLKCIEDFILGVHVFLERIFSFLNSQLNNTTIDQLCGFSDGRAYMRRLPLARQIDFNSGICASKHYESFACPFTTTCKAYL